MSVDYVFGSLIDMDVTQTLGSVNNINTNDYNDDVYMPIMDFTIPKPPKRINGYLFGAVIGQGTYGKVKELVEEQTLVKRAAKIVCNIRLRKITDGHAIIGKEIRIMNRLKHKNIVRMIDSFVNLQKHKTYIIMEYCIATVEGLINATCTKYLTESDSHYLFIQLIDGVEYLHSHGIIHNDIKPANLLLTGDFVLKICDFSVSVEISHYEDNDNITSDKGTPSFKAPEVLNCNQQQWSGSKVDVFAAGATLYYMACGKAPWVSSNPAVMLLFEKICNEEHSFPPEIELSEDFKSLITQMLEKNPESRISIQNIRKTLWFKLSFIGEYTRFKVVNYDSFFPKSFIKHKLEQLYGEPITFKSRLRTTSDEIEWNDQLTRSAPDISPVKNRGMLFATPRSKSYAPGRRPTFLRKWLKNHHSRL